MIPFLSSISSVRQTSRRPGDPGSLPLLAALLLLVPGGTLSGAAIPAGRLPAGGWRPGIPGGIPTGRTQFCNVRNSIPGTGLLAAGDGVANDGPAINAALNAARPGTFVYLPPGTYYAPGGITFPLAAQNITLRGAGPDATRIKVDAADYGIQIRAQYGISGWTNLTTTTAAGTTTVAVANATGYSVGQYALLDMANNPADNLPGYQTNAEAQFVRITAKSGNQLTLERGPYLAYSTARTARISRFEGGAARGCGIEDLAVERTAAAGLHNIYLYGAEECWVKNVKSIRAKKWHVQLSSSVRCEIRRCVMHDTWDGGGDSGYGAGLFAKTTDCLTEDNVFYHCRHSMICEYGGQGNVFGYNYSFDPINENQLATDYLMGDQITHGGLPQFNLWEGNVAATIKFDIVLGGSRYNTVFRGQVQRRGLPATRVACFAADIQRANLYANLVGNVFEPPPPGYGGPTYRWGSTQDDESNPDPQAQGTAYLHGVYDLVTATTTWDAGNNDHALPASLYLGAQPAWWSGGSWPAIGPDLVPSNGGNPAFRRGQAQSGSATPAPPKNLRVGTPAPSSAGPNTP